MKRLALACGVALCGPAFGNDREDSEAKLAALAEPVIAALGQAVPLVDGMTCAPDGQDLSPTNRLLIPNWSGVCRWSDGEGTKGVALVLVLSQSLSDFYREAAGKAEALGPAEARIYRAETGIALRDGTGVKAAPSRMVAAIASPTGSVLPAKADGLDQLAEALAGMDLAVFEAMPEVAAHDAALDAHRALLEGHITALAAMLPPAVDGRDPAARPEEGYPDHMFFGFEPLVQVQAVEAGVTMTVTLTTSSFALENARLTGQFAGREKNGDMGADGVFHDRGRVQVYLRDTHITALIDGRGMLLLDVPDVVDGTDPVAAMEAVLARIAANEFSSY